MADWSSIWAGFAIIWIGLGIYVLSIAGRLRSAEKRAMRRRQQERER